MQRSSLKDLAAAVDALRSTVVALAVASLVLLSPPDVNAQAGCCVCTSCTAPQPFACRDALDDAACAATCTQLECSAHQFQSGTECIDVSQCFGDCCDQLDGACSQLPQASCTGGSLYFGGSYCDGSNCVPQPPTRTPTSTATETPTSPPTATPTHTPIPTNTEVPTDTPTAAPTSTATEAPTDTPTAEATSTDTAAPTDTPTEAPTDTPTEAPTDTPTEAPTDTPTEAPTDTPTEAPTSTPTDTPVDTPTNTPEAAATDTPADTPTEAPTDTPTEAPPTDTPTQAPETPTTAPTDTPTTAPTDTPTEAPPTSTPTETPADTPTSTPESTATPTEALPTPTPTVGSSFIWIVDLFHYTDNLEGISRRGATYLQQPVIPSLQLQDEESRFCTQDGLLPRIRLDLPPEDCGDECNLGFYPPDSTTVIDIAHLPHLNRTAGTFDVLIETYIPCETGAPKVTLRMPGAITYSRCGGDCDSNGDTSVDEVIRGVRTRLGLESLGQCPANDSNGDGTVDPEEILTSIDNALGGCSD